MADSLAYVLSCQICLEDFQDSGKLIPRILPCNHTACERCLGLLLRRNSLTCPECNASKVGVKSVKDFPQNKYILAVIEMKKEEERKTEKRAALKNCEEHAKELTLFCKNDECKSAICATCLTNSHRQHDVVDFKMEEKELVDKLIDAIKNVEAKKEDVSGVVEEAKRLNEMCLKKLQERKEDLIGVITNHYDRFIKDVTQQLHELKSNKEVVNTERILQTLKAIEEEISLQNLPRKEVTSACNKIEDLPNSLNTKSVTCKFFTYNEHCDVTEELKKLLLGDLLEHEKIIRFSSTAEDGSLYKCAG